MSPNIQHTWAQIQWETIYVQMSAEKKTNNSHIYNIQYATEYVWYIKREPFWSLRRSMRNKYLMGGWPTSSSALKSYLSFLPPSAAESWFSVFLRPCSRGRFVSRTGTSSESERWGGVCAGPRVPRVPQGRESFYWLNHTRACRQRNRSQTWNTCKRFNKN